MPNGSTTIEKDDRVIIVVPADENIGSISEIVEEQSEKGEKENRPFFHNKIVKNT